MKKQKWGIITMAAALCLTGCGSSIELNEKQNAEAAEYIAGVLLKYSSNYDKSLIYPEDVVETESSAEPEVTPVATEASKGADGEADTGSEKAEDKDELASLPGFQFACTGKQECSEYTQESVKAYAVYANKGKKLVIVDVKVKNTTSSDKKLNLNKKGFSYQLVTSDEKSYNAQMTAFNNDMNFLSGKVKAKKTKKGIAVFEVPKKTSLKKCQLSISSGSNSITLEVK